LDDIETLQLSNCAMIVLVGNGALVVDVPCRWFFFGLAAIRRASSRVQPEKGKTASRRFLQV
jgi:hypothetical protein